MPRRSTRGFTLIELLIVVSILAILAAVIVPRFAGATTDAKRATLIDVLRSTRQQIDLYREQHDGHHPGQDGDVEDVDPAQFVTALINASNRTGDINSAPNDDFPYGPYLSRFPTNPINGRDDVLIGEAADADGSTGWLFEPATGRFMANLEGADSSGKAFIEY
ncbi:MAG TPA: type II secretion system protein [Tepidisphaeraceae bacterium]|nr:type II secretion system protein [Tepidisphaeraceae bacterium]